MWNSIHIETMYSVLKVQIIIANCLDSVTGNSMLIHRRIGWLEEKEVQRKIDTSPIDAKQYLFQK